MRTAPAHALKRGSTAVGAALLTVASMGLISVTGASSSGAAVVPAETRPVSVPLLTPLGAVEARPAVSADGRFVAFASAADNLVEGDANGQTDVFVRDLVAGSTSLVSANLSGTSGNLASSNPAISADGTRVAFESDATDLVPSDSNHSTDVFVRDSVSGSTTQVSVAHGGAQALGDSRDPSISTDGNRIAFTTRATTLDNHAIDDNGVSDVLVRDIAADTTRVASRSNASIGNRASSEPALSGDGTHVAFVSLSSNFVPGDIAIDADVFVRDVVDDTSTVMVSVGSATSAGPGPRGNGASFRPSISEDGSRVAFASSATNLVADDHNSTDDVFVHEPATHTTERVSVSTGGQGGDLLSSQPSISADGTRVAFYSYGTNFAFGDTNDVADIFVRNLTSGSTSRVSLPATAGQGNANSIYPALSADGRHVTWSSSSTNLVREDTNNGPDVFARDLALGITVPVSVANAPTADSGNAAVSANGRFVAFSSAAEDLVPGAKGLNVFLRDVQTQTTTLVSVAIAGAPADGESSVPAISVDGQRIAFASTADNLVPGDVNHLTDVFVRDLLTATTVRVSIGSRGAESDGPSDAPSISADGTRVAFQSAATTLGAGGDPSTSQIYLHDLVSGSTTLVSAAPDGTPANSTALDPDISDDGRHVAFTGLATDLVAGDTNAAADVFVRDLTTGSTTRVSVSNTGNGQGTAGSLAASISADGHRVAFESGADNLVDGDTNGATDIFVRDLRGAPSTILVSAASGGAHADGPSATPSISDNGTLVTFQSNARNLTPRLSSDPDDETDVFIRDTRGNGTTTRVSVGADGAMSDGRSVGPVMSSDGTHVAFASLADNLVPGDTNRVQDVYLRRLATDDTATTTGGTDRGTTDGSTTEGTSGGTSGGAATDGATSGTTGPTTGDPTTGGTSTGGAGTTTTGAGSTAGGGVGGTEGVSGTATGYSALARSGSEWMRLVLLALGLVGFGFVAVGQGRILRGPSPMRNTRRQR